MSPFLWSVGYYHITTKGTSPQNTKSFRLRHFFIHSNLQHNILIYTVHVFVIPDWNVSVLVVRKGLEDSLTLQRRVLFVNTHLTKMIRAVHLATHPRNIICFHYTIWWDRLMSFLPSVCALTFCPWLQVWVQKHQMGHSDGCVYYSWFAPRWVGSHSTSTSQKLFNLGSVRCPDCWPLITSKAHGGRISAC